MLLLRGLEVISWDTWIVYLTLTWRLVSLDIAFERFNWSHFGKLRATNPLQRGYAVLAGLDMYRLCRRVVLRLGIIFQYGCHLT